MVKHYDQNLDFNDVIIYTASATGFKDYTQTNQLAEGEEEGEEEYGGPEEGEEQRLPINYSIVPPTMRNLGYTPHMVYTGEPKGFFMSFRQEIDLSNQTEVSDKGEILNRLKELISSGNPVLTWLDNTSTWELYFNWQLDVEPLVVRGYDENYVYVDVAAFGENFENRPIATSDS